MDQKPSNYKMLLFYGIMLSSCALYFGYGIGVFNTFYKGFIEEAYGIMDEKEQQDNQGTLNLLFAAGGTLACFTTGFYLQFLGRYRSLILGFVLEIIVCSVMCVKSLMVLRICRFFQGYIGCYWTIVAPLMIKENLPFSVANIVNPLFYCFLTGGIILGYSFGFPTFYVHWRLVFLSPLIFEIPKFLLFLLRFRMESPKWLHARHPEKVQPNYELLYPIDEAQQMALAFTGDSEPVGQQVSIGQLCSPNYRLQFFMAILLNSLNQLTGINILVFYSEKIFNDYKFENTTLLTVIMGVINFSGGVFLVIFSSKLGKRTLLIVGTLG